MANSGGRHPRVRRLTLHSSRLTPDLEASASQVNQVLTRLEQEGFEVLRSQDRGVTTAVVTWGPVSFEFVDPSPGQDRSLQILPGLFVDNLAVDVTCKDLSADEVNTLLPLHQWIYGFWETYLTMHLSRLVLEETVLRKRPPSRHA